MASLPQSGAVPYDGNHTEWRTWGATEYYLPWHWFHFPSFIPTRYKTSLILPEHTGTFLERQRNRARVINVTWLSQFKTTLSLSAFHPSTHVHVYAHTLTRCSALSHFQHWLKLKVLQLQSSWIAQTVQASYRSSRGLLLLFALAFFSALPLPGNCTASARTGNKSILLRSFNIAVLAHSPRKKPASCEVLLRPHST